VREGKGVCYYNNGDKYEGEWKNDKKEGTGTCRYCNADWYIGLWLNDKREGLGSYHYANGDKYEGGWYNGVKEGSGLYIKKDGKKLTGVWKNGRKSAVVDTRRDDQNCPRPASNEISIEGAELVVNSIENVSGSLSQGEMFKRKTQTMVLEENAENLDLKKSGLGGIPRSKSEMANTN
jgi:hypothetical protein